MEKSQEFHQQIEYIRHRATELQRTLHHTEETGGEVVDELVENLMSALEELYVAQEELRVQHSALERSREDLEIERQRYYDLFEYAPDGYLVTDFSGNIQQANQAAVQLLNLGKKFLIGKPLAVFLARDDRGDFLALAHDMRYSDESQSVELRIKPRQSSDYLYAEVTCTPVLNRLGKPMAIRCILRNITQRKTLEEELRKLNADLEARVKERTAELEIANQKTRQLLSEEKTARNEAERANRLKLQFLAMISHELRTPLTSIKGFASTLLAQDITWEIDQWRDFVEIINEEADKLRELVDQLLDLGRIQAGTFSIKRRPVLMREVIEIVMPQLRMLTANHDLIVDVPQNLPEIMVDQHRIAQVITNLVNNAVKHSPAQSEIHIEAQQRDHELEVRVSDQGMGIPSSERDKVFEAFYQHVEEGKQRAGAGLGLAICKGIIEQHQGRIWVDNSHSNGLNTNGTGPKGATVIFTLPIVDA